MKVRELFDELMAFGVEGMTISPGYSYAKAPDQDLFLARKQTIELFEKILAARPKKWKFNQSPLFLEFLRGKWDLDCTPWGSPAYNLFGWQKPCYLLDEGYTKTFDELLNRTDWDNYGHQSGNSKCRDCMVHCGYEPSAVAETFNSLRGFTATAFATIFGFVPRWLQKRVPQKDLVYFTPSDKVNPLNIVESPVRMTHNSGSHSPAPRLVQIELTPQRNVPQPVDSSCP
jgi:hypothetical protein